MCGIFAVVHRGKPIVEADLLAATNTLAHRGPDNGGTTTALAADGAVFVGLGHRRLSIIDLDARAHQPFGDDADGWLTYNGEIYNFLELRKRLQAQQPFRTESDTEVLHRIVTQSGDSDLQELSGMWAFCYFDARRQRLLASRDRYGKKPLFYYADAETLCLASEAKAIFAYLAMKPVMRPERVASYLAFGMSYPAADGSMFFENIREVRPGHTLTLDPASWRLEETPWFDFAAAATAKRPADLRAAVENAVVARLLSDRPVGLLLSGGIDSSLILSVLASRGLQHRVQCFIGETGAQISQDAAFARKCAAIAGVAVHEIHANYGDKAFDRVLTMCWHHEKPFPLTGNSVGMHEMYASIAEQGVKVVLDGTGGDEVFGGYWDRYIQFAIRDAMRAGDTRWLQTLLSENQDIAETSGHIKAALLGLADKLAAPPADSAAIGFGGELIRKASHPDALLTHDGDLVAAMSLDAVGGRLGEWIWHNDRNAMAFGIENRSPLLDSALIPMIGMAYDEKFHGAWNKVRLRNLYDQFVAMPTQWRQQKQGFRWSARQFLLANRAKTRDMISASALLREQLAVSNYLDAAGPESALAGNDFTARLLCIAALENAFC